MKRWMLVAVTGITLAGCGAREPLEPAAGEALPPAPYGAAAPPTAEALLAAPIQTRPGRSDDLIESSSERRSDDFDLPPPDR